MVPARWDKNCLACLLYHQYRFNLGLSFVFGLIFVSLLGLIGLLGLTPPSIGSIRYGWSVEDRFHPDTYVQSTGLGPTAGPGGIGGEGTIHVRRTLGVKMRIDPKEGASSTSKRYVDGSDGAMER